MLGIPLFVVPLSAFLIGLCAVWAVRKVALAVGFVDSPDRRRKLHESPIPLGGGLAVWLATWVGCGVSLLVGFWRVGGAPDSGRFHAGLAIASGTILALGVVDDRYGLRARHKLVGQLIAAAVLVGLGLRIDALGAFGIEVEMGIFAYPVTILWILLVVNAFNLIDGMDGFCGGVGLVGSLAIALISFWSGRLEDAIVGLALAGALVAFLRDNLPPARIYLGDAGSMMIGMLVAALSVRACSDGPRTAVSLPPLVALVALPLLDVATALGRRWLTGRSLFVPDRGHIHHRLRSRLGSTGAALGAAIGLATLGAVGATLARAYGMGDLPAGLAIVISVGLLVGTNTFAGSELRLLSFRLQTASMLLPLMGRVARRTVIRHECHLHGVRDWAEIWDALICEVEAGGVWRIELAIDIPAAGEIYHGLWSLPRESEDGPNWSVTHTLHAGGVPAGVLRVAGRVIASEPSYLDKVEGLVRVLEAMLVTDVTLPVPSAAPSLGRGLGRISLSNPQPEHV